MLFFYGSSTVYCRPFLWHCWFSSRIIAPEGVEYKVLPATHGKRNPSNEQVHICTRNRNLSNYQWFSHENDFQSQAPQLPCPKSSGVLSTCNVACNPGSTTRSTGLVGLRVEIHVALNSKMKACGRFCLLFASFGLRELACAPDPDRLGCLCPRPRQTGLSQPQTQTDWAIPAPDPDTLGDRLGCLCPRPRQIGLSLPQTRTDWAVSAPDPELEVPGDACKDIGQLWCPCENNEKHMEKFGTHAKPLYFALKMSMGTKKTKKKTNPQELCPPAPPHSS